MNVFAHPRALWLLATLPLLAAWVARGAMRRRRDWTALGQGGRLRRGDALGWLGAIALLILALAQPRWGRGPSPPLPPGHDIVFLVDTSRSMGAEDAVPNRLGVAVEAATSLLQALQQRAGNRAAVVAFAGRGQLRCPLTEHLGAAADALEALRPGDVQPGGTNLGAGLEAALDAFDPQEHAEGKTVIVFSDGEDHAASWTALLTPLRDAGIVVHTIAIGDPTVGHSVPSGRGNESLTYQGAPVLSKREDQAMERVARETGGALVPLGLAAVDLGPLYQTRIAPIAQATREAIHPTEMRERFPIFIASALLLGLWGSWPSRGRWLRSPHWLVVAGLLASLGAGRSDDSAAARIAAGRSAYASGRFTEALASFERAIVLAPNAAIPRYDAAAALFRLERYSDAIERYLEARERADAALTTKIDYALGNSALVLGDLPAALSHYDDCLASTARGTDLDAVRLDAAINRKYAQEQAKHASSQSESENAPDSSSNRPQSQSPNPDGSDDPTEGEPDSDAMKSAGGSPPPLNQRSGQPGSSRNGESPSTADSPEGRLDTALKNIREARSRRPDEPLPPTDDQRMDW